MNGDLAFIYKATINLKKVCKKLFIAYLTSLFSIVLGKLLFNIDVKNVDPNQNVKDAFLCK